MCFKYLTLINQVQILIAVATASPVNLIFENCNEPGWICTDDSPDSLKIAFSCNLVPELHRINVSLNDISIPSLVTNFTVSDCQELFLDFHTVSPQESLKYLSVERINLLFVKSSELEFHPVNIVFEDIVHIEELPEGTFGYSKTEDVAFRRVNFGLVRPLQYPNKPLRFKPISICWAEIYTTNVSLSPNGTSFQKAFTHLENLNSFIWEEVSVSSLLPDTIQLSLQDAGVFRLSDCIIDNITTTAISVTGGTLIVDRCVFNELSHFAFNVISPVFFFIGNRINGAVESCAFNVTSSEVYLENNWIHHIKSSGLKCISPEDPEGECPSMPFQFYLRLNHINIIDRHSIEGSFPNRECDRYLAVANNTFDCKILESFQFIFSNAGTNPNDSVDLASYYRKFLSMSSNNTCAGVACHLPVAVALQISKETGDTDPNELCKHYEAAVYYDQDTTRLVPKSGNRAPVLQNFCGLFVFFEIFKLMFFV